jgi:hypothetical protein
MATLENILAEKHPNANPEAFKENLKKLHVVEETGYAVTTRGKTRPFYNVRLIADETNAGIMLNCEEAVLAGLGYDNLPRGIRKESYEPTVMYHLALAAYGRPEMDVEQASELLFESLFAEQCTLAAEVLQDSARRGRLASMIADYARTKVRDEVNEACKLYSEAIKAERGEVRKAIRLRKQIRVAKRENPLTVESLQRELKRAERKDPEKAQALYERRLLHLDRALAYATIADKAEVIEKMYLRQPSLEATSELVLRQA